VARLLDYWLGVFAVEIDALTIIKGSNAFTLLHQSCHENKKSSNLF